MKPIATTGWVDFNAAHVRLGMDAGHARRQARTAIMSAAAAVPAPILGIAWVTGLMAPASPGTIGLALATISGGLAMAIRAGHRWKRRNDRIFLPDMQARRTVMALETLVVASKNPAHSRRGLQKAADDAIAAIQRMRPEISLGRLVRHGYLPSRPVEDAGGGTQRIVDNDAQPIDWHWARMTESLDAFVRTISPGPVHTERRVDAALAMLVPPLRAVLRSMCVDTHVIDYIPTALADGKVRAAPPVMIARQATATGKPAAQPRSEAPASCGPDPLDAVGDRLNAAAAMTASSIRTLTLSFLSAEDDLFAGADRDSGMSLIDEHLPSLIRAYVVAHDAAQGDERDELRAEFAKSLKVVRDALEGIMRRHAATARDRLEIETRFISERHAAHPLSVD